MSKLKYHQQFSEFVSSALLLIYSRLNVTGRFLPKGKRNELLIQYFKKQIKLPRNAMIKKDIKSLLLIARKNGETEAQLWSLHAMNHQFADKFTDADHLFALLTYLYEDHWFESTLDDPDITREKGVIYSSEKTIERCFNSDNELIEPLPNYIIMDEPSRLVELINGHEEGMFIAEHVSTSIEDRCATLLLHKVTASSSPAAAQ